MSFNDIVYMGLLILFSFFLSVFLYQIFKFKKSGDFIIWGLIFCVIGSFFLVVDSLFFVTPPEIRQGSAMILSSIGYGIGFFMFHFFFERNKPEIRLAWNTLVWFVGGMGFGAYIMFALEPIEINFTPPLILWSLVGILIFTSGSRVHWKIYLATDREKIPLFQTFALAIVAFGFFVGFFDSLNITSDSLGNALQLLGLLLYVIPYVFNINYMYRLPIRLQLLAVFSDTGMSIFHIAWKPDLDDERVDLLGGVFQAMNSLLNETLSAAGPVNLIKAPKGTIMLRQAGELMVVVLAESTNIILANSLDRFLHNFSQVIFEPRREVISLGIIRGAEIEEINKLAYPLLEQTFPYLDFPSDVRTNE